MNTWDLCATPESTRRRWRLEINEKWFFLLKAIHKCHSMSNQSQLYFIEIMTN